MAKLWYIYAMEYNTAVKINNLALNPDFAGGLSGSGILQWRGVGRGSGGWCWCALNKCSPCGSARLICLNPPHLVPEDRGPRMQVKDDPDQWNLPEELETSFLHSACWRHSAHRHWWVYLVQPEALEIDDTHFPTFQPSNTKQFEFTESPALKSP